MKRGMILLLMVLLVMPFAMYATGSREDAKVSTEGKSEFAGQTLTMMMTNKEGEFEAARAQHKAFEEKYGVKIEVEVVPSGDAGENLRRTRVATQSLPDIFASSVGAKLYESYPSENVIDIKDQPWIDNLDVNFKKAATIDGAVYGVPLAPSNVGGVFYNKKIFEDLGLDIPLTWDEFLDTCEVIKNAGIAPVAAPNSKTSLTQVPFLMNYYYVNHEDPDFAEKYTRNEITLSDSKAFLGGLQKMYDLAVNEYLNEDALATTVEDVAMMLGDGTAAMSIIRTNILSTMEVLVPDAIENFGFFPLPDNDPNVRGVATWMPMAYLANKNATNPELALLFLEFMTTNEAVEAYLTVQNPTGAFMLNGVKFPDDVYPSLAEAQAWVEKASTPVMEYFSPIKGINQATYTSQVAAGMITPEEAVREIEKDNAISAKQLGLPNW
ncbi:MAG: ABC transporter substrate-binding protein [Sphaerochaetaceae bacterium]